MKIIIDEIKLRWQRILKTENIKKTYNVNKSVSFKLMIRHLKYELCNSLDHHIQDDFIRFDFTYEKLEQKLVRIKVLQNTSRNWKNEYKIARNNEMCR